MLKRKPSGASGSDKAEGRMAKPSNRPGRVTAAGRAVYPDDAPELDNVFFDRAEIVKNGKVVQRGRPPIAGGKEAVKLRIDKDILDFYRSGGLGWQTRVNKTLRRAVSRRARKAG